MITDFSQIKNLDIVESSGTKFIIVKCYEDEILLLWIEWPLVSNSRIETKSSLLLHFLQHTDQKELTEENKEIMREFAELDPVRITLEEMEVISKII